MATTKPHLHGEFGAQQPLVDEIHELQLEVRAITAEIDARHPQWTDPQWNREAHDVLAEVYRFFTGREARTYKEVEEEDGNIHQVEAEARTAIAARD